MTSLLLKRERELDRRRTRNLARQQWGELIDTEARIDECRKLREQIIRQEQSVMAQAAPQQS